MGSRNGSRARHPVPKNSRFMNAVMILNEVERERKRVGCFALGRKIAIAKGAKKTAEEKAHLALKECPEQCKMYIRDLKQQLRSLEH